MLSENSLLLITLQGAMIAGKNFNIVAVVVVVYYYYYYYYYLEIFVSVLLNHHLDRATHLLPKPLGKLLVMF